MTFEYWKININVICTIIKVVNAVDTNRLSTKKESVSEGPDIFSMFHCCLSRGVYHASGPLAFLGSL